MIREAKSPTLVREMLLAYLPEKHRHAEDEAEAGRRPDGRRTADASHGKKKRGEAHGGGHGWFVTFADLMGLLVGFFVMLVAFSTQDQAKLQVVAGSMRDAFGVQENVRYSGIIEVLGLPTRPKLKNAAHIDPTEASATPAPDENDRQRTYGARFKEDRDFALASASLRQALQDMPEITEVSKHIMIEETKQGLNIEIVDQDGRSMFPDGAKEPYERTRQLIQKIAPPLKAMPYRISHHRPHRREQGAAEARLWAVGTVRRPRQCGAPDPRGRGRADRRISSWWPARPTPSRCSRTIPRCRRIAASPSR